MTRAFSRCAVCVALAGLVVSIRATAEETSAADRLARLEAAIAQQQRRIAELDSQLAGGMPSEVDRARTEVLKTQIREVLSESEFRESLMPAAVTAGFADGSGRPVVIGDGSMCVA